MARGEKPVLVVGAGPYGLSITAHLRAHGLPVRIFGEAMDSWRRGMPAGMWLKSAWYASSLSAPEEGHELADYCREAGLPRLTEERPVPIEDFIAYGLWFRDRLVPEVERTRVTRVESTDGGLRVSTDAGEEIQARSVVVATGLMAYAHVPAELASLAPGGPSAAGALSHSSQHSDMTALAARDVVFVGAGQSAIEGAALTHEAGGHATIVARRPLTFPSRPAFVDGREKNQVLRPHSPMGPGWTLAAVHHFPHAFRYLPAATRLRMVRRLLGPYGSWWLRDRVVGRLPVRAGVRIAAARRDGARVALDLIEPGGRRSTVSADHVVAATGYRTDINRLGFLDEATAAAIVRVGTGSPRLDRTFQSSVPGLYFAGLPAAATFGPGQRFVCGAEFAARRISTAIRQRSAAYPRGGSDSYIYKTV